MEIRVYDPSVYGSWFILFKYCFIINGLAKPLDRRAANLYKETPNTLKKATLIYQE